MKTGIVSILGVLAVAYLGFRVYQQKGELAAAEARIADMAATVSSLKKEIQHLGEDKEVEVAGLQEEMARREQRGLTIANLEKKDGQIRAQAESIRALEAALARYKAQQEKAAPAVPAAESP